MITHCVITGDLHGLHRHNPTLPEQNRKIMRLFHASLALPIALLTGCASNWVGINGSQVDHATIAVATTTCQIAKKTRMLENTRAFTEQMQAESQANSEQLSQAYDDFVKRVNDDIASCMRDQGLVAS